MLRRLASIPFPLCFVPLPLPLWELGWPCSRLEAPPGGPAADDAPKAKKHSMASALKMSIATITTRPRLAARGFCRPRRESSSMAFSPAAVGVSFNALASISSQMVITSRRSISEVRRNGEERARDGESKGRTGREASSQRGEEKEGSRGATERDRARDSNRGRESGRVQEGRHSKAFASAALCRIPSLFTVSMLETISRA
mmetsp:Transcript_85084/g.169975  ORF Transcript_85084/g.169975 Transcript_85084/m.169975 type:complete len:201 (-) Transcript_85084:54-656(-)